MALKQYKNLFLLLGIGAVCLSFGLGISYIENHFSSISLVLTAIGTLDILFCLVALRRETKRLVAKSQWRKFISVILLIVTPLSAVIAVNYLAQRYNQRFDVTKNKLHTLSPSTVEIIRGLPQEVKMTVFYVGFPPKYLEDLLKEYERSSDAKIKTEIVDPLVDISYAASFGNVIRGKEKKAIVQSRNERRDVDFDDDKNPLTEEMLDNALLRVAHATRHAYFLAGHNEYDIDSKDDGGLSTFTQHLLINNISSKKLFLGSKERIPDDCDVLIIAGPKKNLRPEDEKTINDYLEKGGHALFLIENTFVTTPDKPLREEEMDMNPSLNSILNQWGIKIGSDIVVDMASHMSTDVGSPATNNYIPHKALIAGLDYTIYIRPRSISMLSNRRPSIKLVPFVLTASDKESWAETNRALKVKFDEGVDRPGPVPIAYVIMEPKEADDISDTRIIVFTDADFLSNALIDQYSNAQMGLNVINWLTESDYKVFKEQKKIEIEQLNLTSKQKRAVVVILVVMPFLIASLGIMAWIKHKTG